MVKKGNRPANDSKKWFYLISFITLAVVVTAAIILYLYLKPNETKNVNYGLPQLELQFASNDTFEDFKNGDKNTKYHDNTLKIFDNKGEHFLRGVTVKGRGNTTWNQKKKPMQIRFQKKTSFLGMTKARKWALLANYFDTSHIRNDTAMYLSSMLDLTPSLQGKYAVLTVDGDYQGLYYITHQIEINKNVVDLRNEQGVLVEIDNLHKDDLKCYTSSNGMCLSVKDIVNNELENEIMESFLQSFNALENAAKKKDYDTVKSLIDVDSFAKYFLLSEFTVNPDAYTSSWFMYRDGLNDKIHAGPGWDYDLALGNHRWVWSINDDFYSPELDMIREIEVLGGKVTVNGKTVEKEPDLATSKLMYYLIKIPEFRRDVETIFNSRMHHRKEELLNHMEKSLGEIYSAAIRDNEKWNRGDFEKEAGYLIDWVSRRYDHFEETYGDSNGRNRVDFN